MFNVVNILSQAKRLLLLIFIIIYLLYMVCNRIKQLLVSNLHSYALINPNTRPYMFPWHEKHDASVFYYYSISLSWHAIHCPTCTCTQSENLGKKRFLKITNACAKLVIIFMEVIIFVKIKLYWRKAGETFQVCVINWWKTLCSYAHSLIQCNIHET